MNDTNDSRLVPLSIIVAGLIIAGAIYFGGGKGANSVNLTGTKPSANFPTGIVAPVTDKDHILGSKDAEIVIVEYSDFECPFCKSFHNTMHQIVDNYGGKVAWVYRQFPIYQGPRALHPKAGKESEASECATDQGGNTAFWKFADKIIEITPSNNGLDPAQLPVIAQGIGLDVGIFNTCLSSGKFTKFIEDSVVAATKAGAQGTPYSVIITKNPLTNAQKDAINALEISSQQGVTLGGNNKVIINGAQPVDIVKSAIDASLK